ncbi:MAG: hypothetical protein QXR69_02015 [Conexivisphaerales archaeon]
MSSVFPFEEFQKLDIRIGRIVDAKQVTGSKKLLELRINLGEKISTAISGIAEFYNPEELKGKEIAVITNLPPRKIFGLQSEVMILAAYDNKNLAYLRPEKDVPEGTKVS